MTLSAKDCSISLDHAPITQLIPATRILLMFALYVQVYQVEYVIVKAANSPRPAAWILEKSLDGKIYQPWQYYAPSDDECWTRYSVPPVTGKPFYVNDNDVICTSQYSRQTPMENGEVSVY